MTISLTLIKTNWNKHFCLWKSSIWNTKWFKQWFDTEPGKLNYPSSCSRWTERKLYKKFHQLANNTTALKEKVFLCKMPQMGKQGMQCMDNIALFCKLQCISLHALKSSAHAVTRAHHICGFTFNCRFISCMIFWEITPYSAELIVFDASLRVFAFCVSWQLWLMKPLALVYLFTLPLSSPAALTLHFVESSREDLALVVCVCRIMCTRISFIQYNSASWH